MSSAPRRRRRFGAEEPGRREFVNLPRRIYLTYKHHGVRSVALRGLTFPLRFTPLAHLAIDDRQARARKSAAIAWYRRSGRPVTIVIPSYKDAQRVAALVKSIRRTTPPELVRIVLADDCSGPGHLAALRRIEGIEVIQGERNVGFAANVNRGIRAADPQHDVVILNSDMKARRGWLALLQFASTRRPDVGICAPKLLYADGRIQFAGSVRNPDAPEWFDHRFRFKRADFAPANVAQPILAATGACMYITRRALDRVGLLDERYPMAYEDVDYCLRAWQAGLGVEYVPDAELTHLESVTRGSELGERERASQRLFWEKWAGFFDARDVRTRGGKLRVIYVTQDTGVGGGHRVIFEHLNRLSHRGHEVELWTLTDGPNWFDLEVPVRRFGDYKELARELAPVEAIKVATWWETAQPVWEASLLHGIPVYFVQDIETSYYRDSEQARQRVLASYRHEFRYLTTSSWNARQLKGLGLRAAVISPGIDLESFAATTATERRNDMALALGRSNPLKNLPLTLAAWRGTPEPRPELCLFGIEPELAEGDPGVRYVEAPSDAQINELLNQATVFIQTSDHEGFCLPVLEAMAAGCPVICTDAHGNRDFCRDGENCLMPASDPKSVTAALRRLLEDASLRERLAGAGVATAAAYSWPRRIDALERFFEDVAAPRRIEPSTDAVPTLRRAPVR